MSSILQLSGRQPALVCLSRTAPGAAAGLRSHPHQPRTLLLELKEKGEEIHIRAELSFHWPESTGARHPVRAQS